MSQSRMRLVLASANPDKAREIAEILAEALGSQVDILPRPSSVPEVVEDGETLEENARLKARAIAEATGEPAIADDTGLEVDALDGAPGVYSARYSGEGATYASNVEKLLSELAAQGTARTACFRTVALVAWPDGTELAAEGSVSGTIATESRGTGGFGYDPVFIPDGGDGRTFAELAPAEKHSLSHRSRALHALAARLGDTSPAAD